MREAVSVTGMVLLSAAFGEADRRVVLLTRERGKITAFAHGARRPGNPLMAVTRPFVFGTFTVFEGRSAYTLQSARPASYFDELSADMEGACYGAYFLEMASYLAQENMDGTELLTLVYQTLKALLKPAIPNRLIRRIFELKAMVINGEYTEKPEGRVSESCAYAWEFVVYSPLGSLYTFVLKPEAEAEFEREVGKCQTIFHPPCVPLPGDPGDDDPVEAVSVWAQILAMGLEIISGRRYNKRYIAPADAGDA